MRDLEITQPNQVWCADVTYIAMARGFLYLVAIMDWASRAVLAWRLSNTLDADFCVRALARFGRPEIFNTDQGSQFTSSAFTGRLSAAGIRISMDGRGRWLDHVFIERLWRSLKSEEVYLKVYTDGHEARAGIGAGIAFDNETRPHQALAGRTPIAVWRAEPGPGETAVDMTLPPAAASLDDAFASPIPTAATATAPPRKQPEGTKNGRRLPP